MKSISSRCTHLNYPSLAVPISSPLISISSQSHLNLNSHHIIPRTNMPWEKVEDDGKHYYYNPDTQETSWTNPEEIQWQQFSTDDGQKYYYNATTGETTWDEPDQFVPEIETALEVPELVLDGAGTDVVTDVVAETLDGPTDIERELESKPVVKDIEVDRDEEAFKRLLLENKVDSTWSFQDVMAKLSTRPQYWSVDDALDRKRLYDEYLTAETKKHISNKTEVRQQFKTNFIQVLLNYQDKGYLNEYTRWHSVKSRLVREENSLFKHSVLPDGEIYEIFKQYQDDMKNAKRQAIIQKKQQAISELNAYLTKINPGIVIDSDNWDDLYEKLQQDDRFKANKHFEVLDKVDILQLCLDTLYPQEIERLETEVDTKQKQNYTNDRKARDVFKSLLKEIPIQADTTFEEILPLIEDEDAFIEICGRNGSTPIELFWDIISEKQQLLKVKADVVESCIQGLDMNLQDVLVDEEKFREAFTSITDDRLEEIDFEDELSLIYEILKKNLEARKIQETKELKASLAQKKNNFVYWLQSEYDKYGVVDSTIDKGVKVYKIKGDFGPEIEEINEYKAMAEVAEKLQCQLDQVVTEALEELVRRLNERQPKRKAEEEPKRNVKRKPVLNY